MSTEFDPAIAKLQEQLQEQEQKVIHLKQMINQLCEFAGKPALYTEAEFEHSASRTGPTIQSDEFYGQPLASSVRKILEKRRAANLGPATVREIYEALKEGGYNFETKNEANAMRGLRVSLSKNTALFHKLPNNKIGLVDWYPAVKRRSRRGSAVETENDTGDETEPENGDEGSGDESEEEETT